MIIYWDKETNSKNRIGKRVKELRIQKKLSYLIRVIWLMLVRLLP